MSPASSLDRSVASLKHGSPRSGVSTPNSRMRALALWELAPLITRSTEMSGQSVQQMIVERLEIPMVGQGMVIPVV